MSLLMARLLWLLLIGVLGVLAPSVLAQDRRPTRTGLFREHPAFHSKFLAKDRDILVYLPPGYETDTHRRYPVFYMHDGQNVFDGATSFIPGKEWQADETAQRLILAHQIEPLIIVGIYNGGEQRTAEYTPTPGDKHQGGKADDYGRMLVEELKPFIDAHYRTRPGPADTALGGSSFGGLASLYIGLKHPGTFGKLAIVSPSVWWDSRYILRFVDSLSRRPHTHIWLDIGTLEGGKEYGLADVENARLLRDTLVRKGWQNGKDLMYMEAEGAEHNETAWAARMEPILRFLFSSKPEHTSE